MEETTIWRENVLGRGGRAYKEWYDVDLAHDMRQGLSRTRGGAAISSNRPVASGKRAFFDGGRYSYVGDGGLCLNTDPGAPRAYIPESWESRRLRAV